MEVDIKTAGVKGLFMFDMESAKIAVPPGFVMSADFFNKFLKETGLNAEIETMIKRINPDNIDSQIEISNEIQQLISVTEFPKGLKKKILDEFSKLKTAYVSVRPSISIEDKKAILLNQEFKSYLNINENNLLDTIKKIWISFYSPRAVLYRIKEKIDIRERLAVIIIQIMINADVSGSAFTKHPVTGDNDQIIIEANYGLTDETNDIKIPRDSYVVRKEDWFVLSKNVVEQKKMLIVVGSKINEIEVGGFLQKKNKISDKDLIILAKICKQIEDFYKGVPQRVEWVLGDGKFYMIHSEPINKI